MLNVSRSTLWRWLRDRAAVETAGAELAHDSLEAQHKLT